MHTHVYTQYMPILMNNVQSNKFQIKKMSAVSKQVHPLNIKLDQTLVSETSTGTRIICRACSNCLLGPNTRGSDSVDLGES